MDVESLQDGAARGGPEEVGAVLGALRSIGLVGPKLALQLGDEISLAKQVADHAGLAYGDWILKLIKDQVNDAYASLEMDLRMDGAMATPGTQSVRDAVEHMEREQAASSKDAPAGGAAQQVIIPKRGRMSKLKYGKPSHDDGEGGEDEKVLRILKDELVIMSAPVLEQIELTGDPARVYKALMGKYRASTIRRYLAYWQSFRKWVTLSTGGVPKQSAQLVDYLLVREEEGMGASVPLSVHKAVMWFERLAGVDDDQRISHDGLVETVVKDLLRKLEEGAPPRRRAPRMLSCFIPALEGLIMNSETEDRLRAGAWVKLVKIWASLRFDDLAHMRRDMARAYEGKLSGLLKRTKTTGAGKRVKELPFHVSTEAWAKHPGWMSKGLEALARTVARTFGLLVPSGASQHGMAQELVMAYQEAVAWSTDVMTAMVAEDGSRLVPDGWERFWTEHSERATLASGLAALGVHKDERDLLGRWTPEGSDQYVRSYNAVITRLQAQFAQPVRTNCGYTAFDEGAVLEDLKVWLVEKWGVEEEMASTAVDGWKEKLKPFTPFADLLEEKEGTALSKSKAGMALAAMESSNSSSDSSSDESKVKKRRVEKLEEERTEGFVIVYNRIDRGKLHKSGKTGCWMARARKFKKASICEQMPEDTEYTSRCKLCWPADADDSSSSDSEDEIEETEPRDPPKGGNVPPVYDSDSLW
eukprot:s679_g19.t1